MTRHDLQEAISNLEYLLLHHFDASKTAEYDHQLQTFRRELRTLDERALAAFNNNYTSRFYRWLRH